MRVSTLGSTTFPPSPPAAMLATSRLHTLAVSDSGFAFDPTSGHTYNLNATALAVLHGLKAGKTPEQVAAQLADTFDVEPEADVARDVAEFVVRLREQGLVK